MSAPRIMIVEDEVIVAMELKSRLTACGYEVVGMVGYGEEAIEIATRLVPDLLLMDIKLAGEIDGIEAARRIHEFHDIPVVYLTAHSDEQTLQKAKLGDPFAYLVKPFSESELRTTIEVALHKHQQLQHARESAEWFSQTVNCLGGAVIGTDEKGTVRHINPLAETLTDFSEAEAVGKPPHEILTLKQSVSGDIMHDLFSANQAVAQASRSLDCILVSRTGREIPIELTIMVSGDSRKQERTMLFAFREISQRVTPLQDWFSWATNLRLTGALCRREGRLVEAESFLRRALDIMETNLGGDHKKVVSVLDELSEICTAIGKDRDAHIMKLRAERIRSQGSSATGFSRNLESRFQPQTMIT
jgi:PAS domain S-box-containing protein